MSKGTQEAHSLFLCHRDLEERSVALVLLVHIVGLCRRKLEKVACQSSNALLCNGPQACLTLVLFSGV